MNIIQMKVKDLIPYEKNAKKHDKTQIANVAESIRQFGFSQPLVVDKDNVLIIGHCRLLAAKQLKLREVPVVRMDELSPEQVDKLRLLDNKLNESEWDIDLLSAEIGELDFTGFDIDWGIDEDEDAEAEIIEDEIPEEIPTIANVGDIWQLGRHRLICGDSTDMATIARLMQGQKAGMVFTDPPYGYSYKNNMSKKFNVIKNDDKMLDFFPIIEKYSDGFIWICTSWKVANKWRQIMEKYYEITNAVIWSKGGGGIGDLKHTFATDYEILFVANRGHEIIGKRYGSVWDFTKSELRNMKKDEMLSLLLNIKKYNSVWEIPRDPTSTYVHPTQKPVALSARAIRSSMGDGIVLDLFGGSGSTLMACEQIGRTCYMAELDPQYADVIIARWQEFTGERAERIDG